MPSQFLRVHELKMSDVRGWSMLCDDPVSILALYIPEEDRCIDILELIEHEDLLLYVFRFPQPDKFLISILPQISCPHFNALRFNLFTWKSPGWSCFGQTCRSETTYVRNPKSM